MYKNDRCTTLQRFITVRTIQEFAALWCGASEDELGTVLEKTYGGKSGSLGSIIVKSDDFPCLEPRIRFIVDAIKEERVEACDESGNFRGNKNIAWSRMCLRLDKAKEWLENSALPREELPDFIFKSESEGIKNTVEGLEHALNKIKELEKQIEDKNKIIAELESQSIGSDETGAVNSERWKHSCRALAKTFAAYINNQAQQGITKQEFLDYMKTRVEGFRNPLGIVENIAWQELPVRLKHGPGRPSNTTFDEIPF